MLNVLVVDDEEPALEELAYLLALDPRIRQVRTAATGARALQALESSNFDAVFLDIRMPGLDGLDLARLLDRFAVPPKIVFVTAYESFAVDAFELKALDYVLKPVSADRLAETVRRIATADAEFESADEIIPVELGGVLQFVNRSDVRYVEAHGDYARLHTVNGNHLIRIPLATLEDQWRDAGFVRIHRRHLVAVRHIDQLRVESGHCSVLVGHEVLQVSRRHTQELRDLLAHQAQRPRA